MLLLLLFFGLFWRLLLSDLKSVSEEIFLLKSTNPDKTKHVEKRAAFVGL